MRDFGVKISRMAGFFGVERLMLHVRIFCHQKGSGKGAEPHGGLVSKSSHCAASALCGAVFAELFGGLLFRSLAVTSARA